METFLFEVSIQKLTQASSIKQVPSHMYSQYQGPHGRFIISTRICDYMYVAFGTLT